MWKTVSKFCVFVLGTFSAAAGIVLYVLFLKPELKEHFTKIFSDKLHGADIYFSQIFATILIVIPLLILLAKLRAKKNEEPLVYHTAEGPVVIEAATLSNFVKSVIKSYEPVNRATVRTEADNKKVNVIARVFLNDNQPVAAVVSELQIAVRRRVHKAFGIDLLRDIRIEVARLTATKSRSQKLLSEPDAEESNSENANGKIENADYEPAAENV